MPGMPCPVVVDDEPEIRNFLKDLLEYLGYEAEFAATGKRPARMIT
jgi:CheY-like chemotaxis protein